MSSTGDNVLARKESDRGTLSHVALPRILQSNLLGSQERRRLATGVRLKVSESLRTQGEIQDDHSPSSDKCIQSRGLGHKCRCKRRLLPYLHTPQVQTPAPLCHSRERRAPSFSIQSCAVRSDFGAKGIQESDSTHRSSGTHTAVSRRLDTEKYRQDTIGSANKLVATYHAPGRTGAKCAKVAVNTNPTIDTDRRRILARCRTNVPADGQGSQDRKRSVSSSIHASDDSVLLVVSPWTYELGNGCHRTGEIASQTSAALLARSRVPSIESSGGTDTSETQLTRSPLSPVLEQEVHASRNVAGHSGGSDAVVYRRVGVGLGSPFRHFPGERRMVCEGDYSPYQSTGNASGTQCVGSIQNPIFRPNCLIDVGQRNRCVIHKEAGWHNLRTNVSASEGSAPRSTGCEYLPSGQAHSGRTECTSRPSFQNEQSGPYGVNITPIRGGCTQHPMGRSPMGI